MRTLYFDIDGTILNNHQGEVKPMLGAGRLERAVRSAGFLRLVCVGNFAGVAHAVQRVQPDYDAIGVLFTLCQGAFENEDWLRVHTTLVSEPENRAAGIDLSGDWWYMDDLAEHYMHLAGLDDVFGAHRGSRVCVPAPGGDGGEVLAWLGGVDAR